MPFFLFTSSPYQSPNAYFHLCPRNQEVATKNKTSVEEAIKTLNGNATVCSGDVHVTL